MLNKKFKKAISAVTMFATVVVLSGVSMLAPLTASAATTIVDGDLIKSNATNSDGTPTIGSLDVYIVKIVGTKKFKRLVLNPNIFNSYGHLKWENIKTVSQAEEDGFTTSSLVRVDGDTKVYALTPVAGGDTGAKSWVNVTADQFVNGAGSDPDSIYTINGTDSAAYSAKPDITTVTALKAFYKDGTLPAGEVSEGALKVSLSADSAESANVPLNVSVEFAKFNLTASDKADVIVDSITFKNAGFETDTNIDSIAVYDADGNRLNKELKDMTTSGATVSLNHLEIAAGQTETITVKATITDANNDKAEEGIYVISIDKADDINSNASSVSGSFAVEGNEMNAVYANNLSTLTVAAGATLGTINIGDENVALANFKLTASGDDATLNRVTLKRNASVTDSAADDDFENLALYNGTTKIATADEINNRLVTFIVDDGLLIEDGKTVKLTMKGDVVDGAGKYFNFYLDNVADVDAMGIKYPAIIAGSFVANNTGVQIKAGDVTLEKVNAVSAKVKDDTTNVELGTIKITANSGEDVAISKIGVSIVATGETVTANAFAGLTNVELYDATDKITYDLDYVTAAASNTKVYSNDDVDIVLGSGETHEFILRGDTSDSSDGYTYTATMTASSHLTIKTVADEVAVSKFTPSSVDLKKVTVEAPSVSFTKRALSASKTAVAGSEDIEAIRFDIEAGSTAVTVNELSFADTEAGTTMDDDVISGFSLFKLGETTAIATASGSDISGEEVTFTDLGIELDAEEIATYYVTVDVADNATGDITLRLSGYGVEDEDGDVYDATNDDVSTNGIIAAGEVGATALKSARKVTIVDKGSLAVSIDNSLTNTKKDVYAVAGTTGNVLAALKLKANNEDIEINTIKVEIAGATDASAVFSKLYLVDGTSTIATATKMGTAVAFEDMAYIAKVGETTLYLKGDLNLIGEDEAGELDDVDITFTFDGIEAVGDSSGADLAAASDGDAVIEAGEIAYDANGDGVFNSTEDATLASKKLGVLASKISAVTLGAAGTSYDGYSVQSDLVAGQQNVAIIAVTADNTSNTNSDGEAVKIALSKIQVNINTSETLVDAASMDTRIKATDGEWVDGAITGNNLATFTVSGSDFEIAAGETKYFVVQVNVGTTFGAGDNDDYLKASLSALDGTSTTGNFGWTDSDDTGTDTKYELRLGTSSVDGVYMKG